MKVLELTAGLWRLLFTLAGKERLPSECRMNLPAKSLDGTLSPDNSVTATGAARQGECKGQ